MPDSSSGGSELSDPPGPEDVPGARLLALVQIMDTLRTSCPWDQAQTHASLRRYLIEEAYEAVDAIEADNPAELREEIGDVLLQVLFHARIASERSAADDGFTIDDVADTLAAKLIRRHPHVFGSVSVSSAADVNANWEEIKQEERAAKAQASGDAETAPSALDGVPFGQPALSLAAQVLRRAERAGIAVPAEDAGPAEPDAGGLDDAPPLTGERVGMDLMALVARAQAAGLDPELELRAAVQRFADQVREQERPVSSPLYPFAGPGRYARCGTQCVSTALLSCVSSPSGLVRDRPCSRAGISDQARTFHSVPKSSATAGVNRRKTSESN